MGNTIIGPEDRAFPYPVAPTIVQVKPSLDAQWWRTEPRLEMVSCSVHVGSGGRGELNVKRRYGENKQPWEADTAPKVPWAPASGWWVRVIQATDTGRHELFLGRFESIEADVHGSDTPTPRVGQLIVEPSGLQTWIAHGPRRILERISVSTSFWKAPEGEVRQMGWIPAINQRDDSGAVIGNRSQSRLGATYVHADEAGWNHLQYIEYLLGRFTTGNWSVSGQTELLSALSEPIRFGKTQTLDQMIGKLIPTRLGVDWRIEPGENGSWQIVIYSLVAEEHSFGDATLPRNPDTVEIRVGESADSLRTRLVYSTEQTYGRIRVLGDRIVVCCSLWTEEAPEQIRTHGTGLTPKWTTALEKEYLAGDPDGSTAAAHDAFREKEKFRPVFQQFEIPAEWDFNERTAAPLLDESGELVVDPDPDVATPADRQTYIRKTLSWLPLFEGVDYSENPPVDNNPAGHHPELLPPAVWLANRLPPDDEEEEDPPPEANRYVAADEAGVCHVFVAKQTLGISLMAKANHLLALKDWDVAAPAPAATNRTPKYDCRNMVATIAFESDQRLQLVADLHDDPDPDQGIIDIEVPDAELWYLAPHTVLGDDSTPSTLLVKTSGPKGRVLRTDVARLMPVMVGAIARYHQARCRAEITVAGVVPYTRLLGRILTAVAQDGHTQRIQAPITSVTYSPTQTVMRTGHAR